MQDLHAVDCRSYIPEPERGRRNWEGKEDEQKQVYANRRRVQGARSKRLQRKRSELTERSMAHMYETGEMRRVHLKGRDNILKRLLVHAGGFNLALIMRTLVGIGKPRRLQGACACTFAWRCQGFCVKVFPRAIFFGSPDLHPAPGLAFAIPGLCRTRIPG